MQLGEEELMRVEGNQTIINDPALTLIESKTKVINQYILKIIGMALDDLGFSDSTINLIKTYLNKHKTIIISVYQDDNGNILVIITAN
jgi:hypothetical protein